MNKKAPFIFFRLISSFLIILIFFCGCAYQRPVVKAPKMRKLTGKYHKVHKGETLWSIAKAYNISLDEVVRINRIPNAARIEPGQLIFIPGTKKETSIDSADQGKKFIWPVKGEIISYFGNTSSDRMNRGIDIKVASDRDISATRSGKVVFSGYLKGYGQTVIVDHLDGFFSVYSNIHRLLAKFGDNISQGQVIAKLNNDNAVIHFEIRQGDNSKNPLYYLP